MSTVTKPKSVRTTNAVRALLRGRYQPADEAITEVAPPAKGVNVVRDAGQPLLEQEGEAVRIKQLLGTAAGVRSVLRTR